MATYTVTKHRLHPDTTGEIWMLSAATKHGTVPAGSVTRYLDGYDVRTAAGARCFRGTAGYDARMAAVEAWRAEHGESNSPGPYIQDDGDNSPQMVRDRMADDLAARGDPRDDEPESAYTDAEALDAVQEMLRDPDWDGDMLEDIADIVRKTGRAVENYPDGRSTWRRH